MNTEEKECEVCDGEGWTVETCGDIIDCTACQHSKE